MKRLAKRRRSGGSHDIDVAATAGVAIGTVSRFLNGCEIRRGNREQIEAAIEKLSYRRNAVAAAMKTDTTHMIGLLIRPSTNSTRDMVEQLGRRCCENRAGRW